MTKCIVIFATAWGARYGGINSFNYDLCVALANLLQLQRSKLSIVCILNEHNDAEDEAITNQGARIQLYKVPHHSDSEIEKETIYRFIERRNIVPVCTMGHDVYTGRRAIDLAGCYDNIPNAVFHHMNYRAYRTEPSDKPLIQKQERILQDSHTIFAVGPTLTSSARTKVGNHRQKVKQVLPGITVREGLDQSPDEFLAVTLGRVKLESDTLKQIKLATASFGRAVYDEPFLIRKRSPNLTIIGLSKADLAQQQASSLHNLADDYAGGSHVPLSPWPYDESREDLFQEISKKTVCMVLSWYEGFSLVGLEAISVGVPLILSTNTGLYEAIKAELGVKGLGCIRSVDISGSRNKEKWEENLKEIVYQLREVANSARNAREDPKKDLIKLGALSLRDDLARLWTWEKTAQRILQEFNLPSTISAISAPFCQQVPSPSQNDPSELSPISSLDCSTSFNSEEHETIQPLASSTSQSSRSGNLANNTPSTTSQEEFMFDSIDPEKLRPYVIEKYGYTPRFNTLILDLKTRGIIQRGYSGAERTDNPAEIENRVTKLMLDLKDSGEGKYGGFVEWFLNKYPGIKSELMEGN